MLFVLASNEVGYIPLTLKLLTMGLSLKNLQHRRIPKLWILSHEQIQLFKRRYNEGYDLPDPVYLKWLGITHPKEGQTGDQPSGSISNHKSGVFSGEQDHQFHRVNEEVESPNPYSEQYNENVSLSELAFDSISSETLGLERSFVESVTELQVESTNTAATTSVPMIEPPEHEGELNFISKYLIQYVPVKKVQRASKRATGATVLTSDECAKSIFEQDEKKRKEKEEKEARKVEREQKKKEQEEAAKPESRKNAKKRKRLLEREKKLLRKGKRLQEKKPKSLLTSRIVLLGNAKKPMLLIQAL